MKILISIFLYACLLFACKSESTTPAIEDPPQDFTHIEQTVKQIVVRDGIPALSAAIIKDGGIVWQASFGVAHSTSQKSPGSETIYLLASISKLITATAVMQLAENGLIDIDANLATYLPFEVSNPDFPNDPITARLLLTHSSSLAKPQNEDPGFYVSYPGDTSPSLFPWVQNYLVPGNPEYVDGIWKPERPGQTFRSSNIGPALLGYLVQQASGKDFAEYCKENIFAPLDMQNTGFRLSDIDTTKLAELHSVNGLVAPYSVIWYPAVMLRSSLEDLSHFLFAFMSGGIYNGNRILKEATVHEMLEIKHPNANMAFGAGLGLMWRGHMNNIWVGHTGGLAGVSSSMDFHPDHNVGVIILSNKSQQFAVYPGGDIYQFLHREAEKLFD